jgi:hypothetical protein
MTFDIYSLRTTHKYLDNTYTIDYLYDMRYIIRNDETHLIPCDNFTIAVIDDIGYFIISSIYDVKIVKISDLTTVSTYTTNIKHTTLYYYDNALYITNEITIQKYTIVDLQLKLVKSINCTHAYIIYVANYIITITTDKLHVLTVYDVDLQVIYKIHDAPYMTKIEMTNILTGYYADVGFYGEYLIDIDNKTIKDILIEQDD